MRLASTHLEFRSRSAYTADAAKSRLVEKEVDAVKVDVDSEFIIRDVTGLQQMAVMVDHNGEASLVV